MIAKPGLDGHDRGAKVVARALRDAGIIPDADLLALEAMGVHAVFTPGADLRGIVEPVHRLTAIPDDTLEPAC